MFVANRFFWSAVGQVFSNPGVTLRIVMLPLVLSIAVWIVTGEGVADLVDLVLFGWVAIAWHRHRILGDNTAQIARDLRLGLLFRYIFDWIIVGFLSGFLALIMGGLLALILWYPAKWLGASISLDFFDAFLWTARRGLSELSWADLLFSGTVMFGTVFVLLFSFFAMGRRLPAVATGKKDVFLQRPISSGWRIPVSVLWCAVLWGIGLVILIELPNWMWSLVDHADGPAATSAHVAGIVISQLIYALNVLIGASVLTELFLFGWPRATQPPLPEDGSSDGSDDCSHAPQPQTESRES